MGNFFKDNKDLRFYLEHGLDWDPVVELTEYLGHSKDGFATTEEAVEFYGDILDLVGQFVADEVAPHAAQIDREGVHMEDGEAVFPDRLQGIFDQIKALELHGMCLPRELGGQNCPLAVYLMALEVFARADVSVCAHFGFHGGLAMAMLVYSLREGSTEFDVEKGCISKTRWADYIEEIRRGDAWGCMDITEPDAGSDMARMRCIGEQDEDGNWYVTGQKIFITSGHGKYHFVIARTEDAKKGDEDNPMAGLQGLSMFLVPTYTETTTGKGKNKKTTRTRIVSLDRLEEKLGHHGSATAALTFERAPADLVGKRGEGFLYMLTLMNNARLGVGFESLGCMEAALRSAKEYAAERGSMGKTIDKHEMIADYIEEMETDIAGIRAISMYGTYHQELAQKIGIMVESGLLDSKLKDDWRAAQYKRRLKVHKAASRRATPLIKYIAAEKAVFMAQRSIQIHGGNGYTTDYPAEKLLRDAMVFPIYEGTSQIQALMAMKDTLGGIMKDPADFLKRTAQARWRSVSARDPLERRVAKIQSISLSTQQYLITRTAADKYRSLQGMPVTEWPDRFLKNWNPKRDFSYAMLHAERLTQILCDELIVEVLWSQAQKHEERRILLENYLDRAEARCKHMAERITTTGDSLLARLKGTDTASSQRKAG